MKKVCLCCESILNLKYKDNSVEIFECNNCSSLKIDHKKVSNEEINKDYYLNKFYDQKQLKKSIQKTRKRQASKIIKLVSKFVTKKSIIIDYGCGRGVFLKEVLRRGYVKLIGVESSEKAIKDLQNIFTMIKVDLKEGDLVFNKKFKNREKSTPIVLFALDVIEHFPNEKLFIWLEKCIDEFLNPSLIIIKIPSRKGLMLRLSFLLAYSNLTNAPLHQLLQVGTYPPHYSYISKNGIKKIFRKLGYKNVLTDSDLEYDIFCLSSRMGLKGLNKIIVDYFISPIFGLVAHLFRKKDSDIFIFKKVDN